MVYDAVHAIKGAHASHAVLGFVFALNSAFTTHQQARAPLKPESPNPGTQNGECGKPLNVFSRLLGLAVGYAYLAYLLIAVCALKLVRLATGRD
jgi:hypothetical protein